MVPILLWLFTGIILNRRGHGLVYISRGILDNYEMQCQWRARTWQDHNPGKMYVMYLCTYAVACTLVPVYASSNPCLSSFQRALKYGHAYYRCSCSCNVLLPSCLNVLLTARPCAQIRPLMVTWAPKYTCTGSHGRPNMPLSAPLLSLVQSPAQGIAKSCQVPIAWGDLTQE